MGLKDWELERDGEIIIYSHKKYSSVTLSVGTYNVVKDKPVPAWSGKSYVQVEDPGKPRKFAPVHKLYNSKAQAIASATNYRRTH